MPIRDAALGDLPAIVAIYNENIPTRSVTADTEPVSVGSKVMWFEAHSRDRHPLWVLDEGGEIVAWVSFQPFKQRAAYAGTAEISVYIRETHRRRGLGKLLLREAINRAPKFGIKRLAGFILGNNAPSLKLFEAMGFERWALLPGVCELDGV